MSSTNAKETGSCLGFGSLVIKLAIEECAFLEGGRSGGYTAADNPVSKHLIPNGELTI